ncbi:MAG: hypothetical protein H0V35_12635 [Nitrospira sp.]|nr:hypothetical protein [Nitrospira sp.]
MSGTHIGVPGIQLLFLKLLVDSHLRLRLRQCDHARRPARFDRYQLPAEIVALYDDRAMVEGEWRYELNEISPSQ